MKNKIRLNLNSKAYDIIIGYDILGNLSDYIKGLGLPSKDVFIITNNFLKKKYGNKLKAGLKKGGFSFKFYTTIDSEKAKTIDNALRFVNLLAEYAGQRKITIIAFGGGVIGDLAGFIASIYKRGAPLIHIPTTLLAQLDSSIGGKTAIDLNIGKNLVGTFYQPKLVVSDIHFLNTLDKKQLRSGLAEIIKYAIIDGDKLFTFIEHHYQQILNRDIHTLIHVIYECSKIKARIVELDEKETKGIRTFLNFGHTIGHALEAAGHYKKYNHGQALGIGILCAAKISKKMSMLSLNDYRRIENLIMNVGLPQEITDIKEEDIIKAYKLDKKFIGKTNRFVLLKKIGKPIISLNVPENIINSSLRELFVS